MTLSGRNRRKAERYDDRRIKQLVALLKKSIAVRYYVDPDEYNDMGELDDRD